MIIQPGTDIGRYHILEQLGEGGMAVVYKAFDTRLETEVAVKVIRVGDITPNALPRILKRFQIEAKKMAQMTHPNIVRVLDYGEFKGAPYLVMPYLPGGPLKNKLGKPMDGREAIRLLLPIADAIGYAHKKGIIHRDIKPSNILITEEGQTMLSDFGVAKVMESEETQDLSSSGMGVGTPEYMAPEVGMQKEFDYRADIYSLGIVLYEMVTGRRPFRADTPVAVLLKHATEPLPRPSSFNPGVPEEIERLLFKALAKNPKDRFSDMGSFAKAMEQVKTHKLRKTTEPAPKYHILTEANRPSAAQVKKPLEKKWLYGLLGTVGLVLVLCLATIMIQGLDSISLQDTGKANALATSANAKVKTSIPTVPSDSNSNIAAVKTPTLTYLESVERDGTISINYSVLTEGILFEGDNQIIYITDPYGKSVEMVTRGTYPEWSKDNSLIAFIWRDYLYIADIKKERLISAISLPNGDGSYPSFSQDNQKIVFSSNNDIYIAHIDSSEVERITNDEFMDYQTTWSPVSNKIAFSSNRQGNKAIFLLDAESRDIQRVSPIKYDADTPAWADNGSSILFQLYQPPTNYGKVYKMSSYGTGIEVVDNVGDSFSHFNEKISFSNKENLYILGEDWFFGNGSYEDRKCTIYSMKGKIVYDFSLEQKMVCANPSWSY